MRTACGSVVNATFPRYLSPTLTTVVLVLVVVLAPTGVVVSAAPSTRAATSEVARVIGCTSVPREHAHACPQEKARAVPVHAYSLRSHGPSSYLTTRRCRLLSATRVTYNEEGWYKEERGLRGVPALT